LERYSSSHSSYGWFAGHNTSIFYQLKENDIVDKNRIEGSVKQVKGSIEEAAGKVLGDAKLTAKGKADKVAG
jgi:CsbD-like